MTRMPDTRPRRSFIRICQVTAAALALCALPLGAQQAPATTAEPAKSQNTDTGTGNGVKQELLANSPFMSKAFKERLAKSDGNRARDLTFIGFAGDSGSWLICVYNNQSKRAEWVEVGAEVNGVNIAEFDRQGLRIRVIKDATSTYLPLEKAK